MLPTPGRDLLYAARALRKVPAFTAAVVLCLALAVGAASAVFAVVDHALLRPLPYRAPSQLVAVWERRIAKPDDRLVASPANVLDWQARSRAFAGLAAAVEVPRRVTVGPADLPEEVAAQLVTPNAFALLGVAPALGRGFAPPDARPDAPPVVVLSDAFWRHRLGSDLSVVGRTLVVDGRAATVVGVMPPGTRVLGADVRLWAPLLLDPGIDYRGTVGRYLGVVGRLRPGVTPADAQRDLDAVARRLAGEHPAFNEGWGVSVVPLREQLVGDVRRPLGVLAGAAALALLVAAANLSTLQLARATARRHEFAVRRALGAGRWQVARVVVAEMLTLAAGGGLLGLGLAWAATRALGAAGVLGPGGAEGARRPGSPGAGGAVGALADAAVDARVVAFVVALALGTGLLIALAPALRASRAALVDVVRAGARGAVGAGRGRAGRALLVGQTALVVTLLIAAGLLLKSFARLQGVAPGFATAGVMTARLTLPPDRYAGAPQRAAGFADVVGRLQAMPGVRAAGAVSVLPLAGGLPALAGVEIVGRPEPTVGEGTAAQVRVVAGDAFRALGVPLLRGAALTGREAADAPKQVVVSAAFVARRLPGEDPVGVRIVMPWGGRRLEATVVGVVGDVRASALDSLPEPTVYWTLPQLPVPRMALVARHDVGGEVNARAALRRAVREADPELALADVRSTADHVRASLAGRRLGTTALAALAGAALLLAATGVYGAVAYAVARSTRELGLRAALGAPRSVLQRLMIARGMRPVVAGTALGVAGALALSRVLRGLLYEVSATDAPTFVVVPLLLTGVALLACHLPARRAARADPMAALRQD